MVSTATSIRQTIESEVSTGVRLPGDRLPSVRSLATELDVSPNTVASAYRQLRERGIVLGRGRQGTIVAPLNRPSTNQVTIVPDGVIDAMRGSPDPALLPDLAPAFAHATSSPQAAYGDELLDSSFAQAARSMFEADGIDATNLVVTSGAMDSIERVLVANNLRPGDRVGVEDPGHVPVHQIVRSMGLIPVPLEVDEHGITPAALTRSLTQSLAAIIVTPRAQNPTGAALNEDRAAELSEILRVHTDMLLIQDDHAGQISGAPWHSLTPPGDRHVIMRSLGKAFGPDLRVSVSVGDALTIDRVAVAVSNGPGWVSHILQRSAGYLLTDDSTAKLVRNAAEVYTDRRNRLISRLSDYGVAASGASGINVWIPTDDEQATVEAARAAGFAVRAADAYRLNTPPATRVTISLLDEKQIDDLAEAIGTSMRTTRHSPAV